VSKIIMLISNIGRDIINPLQTTLIERGIVSSRVALLLRSAEIKPVFSRLCHGAIKGYQFRSVTTDIFNSKLVATNTCTFITRSIQTLRL